MGPVDIYALALGGVFLVMIGRHVGETVPPVIEYTRMVFNKYLRVPYAVEPNRLTDGFTRLAILRQTVIVIISLCAIFVPTGQTGSLVSRAGIISAVHLAPCYLAVHMSYAADLLCMCLGTFRALHIEFGVALVVSIAIHISLGLRTSTMLVWTDTQSRYGVIVSHQEIRGAIYPALMA